MRRVGISEARRLLPELVRTIAAGGGQVDITYRGKPQVSLVRVSDVKRVARLRPNEDPALRVELDVPGGDLIGAIRALRAQQGKPRTWWLDQRPTVREPRVKNRKAPRRPR
jgi:antitoxin (DNA-binding transcriptional repressor) of toxin-antitoxin stability system